MNQRYFLAFWNLENLFAPEKHPERESWLQKRVGPDLKGWTKPLFARKISQLSLLIRRMNDGSGPDVLGFCEVENRFAVDALVSALNALLPNRRYVAMHADSTQDQRGIDTGFLFDQERLHASDLFNHWAMRRTGTRDITQVTFKTERGNEFVALANHWPSRSGSTPSAGFRATAAETLAYWHRRIREEKGVDIAVIAMGDLNDEPFDPSVTIHANATREETDLARARSARFYNLTWRYAEQHTRDVKGNKRRVFGTLYFKGNGNLFDQILASASLLKKNTRLHLDLESAQMVLDPIHVTSSTNPAPIRFGLPKGDAQKNLNQDGFSDHYPVSVELVEKS